MKPPIQGLAVALRPTLKALGWLALAAAVATPALILASPGRTLRVEIEKFAYGPKEVTVAPGTTIVWTNRDATPHTVTSREGSFASKGMDTDDTFEHTFPAEGDFAYLCTVHPFMTGTIHVRR